ncbi:hypothetical protein V1290_000057 [Bradyrhizobium sp. AZCC 1578]|uniref:hypothetical protein n=1 Tax=Bradyrhizobium sp. AZCC 1578 TaxID=3117027 RepID=UPI002FF270BF
MSVDLLCVNPADTQKVWPLARDLIRAAIERTGLSDFADIEEDVLSGDQLLWLAISDHIEAAATTHLTCGVCTITACSGHQRERWLPLLAQIEKYAKDEGCKMRIYGRVGWQRVLDGYHVEHVILEKDLGR